MPARARAPVPAQLPCDVDELLLPFHQTKDKRANESLAKGIDRLIRQKSQLTQHMPPFHSTDAVRAVRFCMRSAAYVDVWCGVLQNIIITAAHCTSQCAWRGVLDDGRPKTRTRPTQVRSGRSSSSSSSSTPASVGAPLEKYE